MSWHHIHCHEVMCHDNDYDIMMTMIMTSCLIMTSWQWLWHHDNNYDIMTMIMTSWQWLWHHDNDYEIMTMIMTSWCHNLCQHDIIIMTMIITTMIMTSRQGFWCHDNDYDVMPMIMMSWQWLWHFGNYYDIMT